MNQLEAFYWPMYLQQWNCFYQGLGMPAQGFIDWRQASVVATDLDHPSISIGTPQPTVACKMEGRLEVPNIVVVEEPAISKRSPSKNLRRKNLLPLEKPERNALTNMSNQLLTFLYTRRRSGQVLLRLFPNINVEEIDDYYLFVGQLKQSLYGYISEEKMLGLWHPDHEEQPFNYSVLRALSHYYLRERLIGAILTSKRMPKGSKTVHLKVRRKMLRLLSFDSQ
jgi:hypothetical protein